MSLRLKLRARYDAATAKLSPPDLDIGYATSSGSIAIIRLFCFGCSFVNRPDYWKWSADKTFRNATKSMIFTRVPNLPLANLQRRSWIWLITANRFKVNGKYFFSRPSTFVVLGVERELRVHWQVANGWLNSAARVPLRVIKELLARADLSSTPNKLYSVCERNERHPQIAKTMASIWLFRVFLNHLLPHIVCLSFSSTTASLFLTFARARSWIR